VGLVVESDDETICAESVTGEEQVEKLRPETYWLADTAT